MSAEEEEDVVAVPDMDAVLLLVAGGAEGGARPRSLGEEGVVSQRTWEGQEDTLSAFQLRRMSVVTSFM